MPPQRRILDVQQQADSLLDQAEGEQAEQQAALETLLLASEYSAALAAQIEVKYDQAEWIEDRFDNLIEQQETRLL